MANKKPTTIQPVHEVRPSEETHTQNNADNVSLPGAQSLQPTPQVPNATGNGPKSAEGTTTNAESSPQVNHTSLSIAGNKQSGDPNTQCEIPFAVDLTQNNSIAHSIFAQLAKLSSDSAEHQRAQALVNQHLYNLIGQIQSAIQPNASSAQNFTPRREPQIINVDDEASSGGNNHSSAPTPTFDGGVQTSANQQPRTVSPQQAQQGGCAYISPLSQTTMELGLSSEMIEAKVKQEASYNFGNAMLDYASGYSSAALRHAYQPQLPEFSGEPDTISFANFWPIFKVMVHCQPHLTDTQKTIALLQKITGTASKIIGTNLHRPGGYVEAIECLLRVYGNTTQNASELYDKLRYLPTPHEDDFEMLHQTVAKMRTILNEMADVDPALVTTTNIKGIVTSKLPEIYVERVKTKISRCSIRDFLNAIDCEITQRRSLHAYRTSCFYNPQNFTHRGRGSFRGRGFSAHRNQSYNRSSYNQDWSSNQSNRDFDQHYQHTTPNGPQHNNYRHEDRRQQPQMNGEYQEETAANARGREHCSLCQFLHTTESCKIITDLETRRALFAGANRCFKCEKIGHKGRDCKSNQECSRCQGKNHCAALCPQDFRLAGQDRQH